MKIFLGLFFSVCVFLSNIAFSLEKGKWSFVKTDEYCYIGSLAIETDLSPEKSRGDFYILVYKNIGSPETVIQLEAGYDYKIGNDINVKIDKGAYSFYTTEEIPTAAWTKEDSKVIFAMKKGLKLVVTAESSRGTITNDTYTLKGFTASYSKLVEDC
ncbi:invasion associated locus B family protein [Pelagibacteraceae bacterium]|nr:invasion associated locus B family protein [Pelagibacteraceae bacterium]